jgi:S1-C subfamily serine protease
LGIRPGNYETEDGGVLVDGVSPGGAAEKGGVKDGDVIVEIGGKPVKNIGTYMTAMSGQKPGTQIEIVVMRKGQKVTLKVTPE